VKAVMGRVNQGDCIEGMKAMQAGSVDLVFADPPFNIGYEYDAYDDRQEEEKYLDWSRQWIKAVHRVLKPNGTFWLAIGDEYAAELKLIARKEAGFTCRSWVIWYYTFGVHCKKKFTRSHAHLFHFVKDEKDFTFNVETVRVPSARQLVYNDKRQNPNGRMPDDTWIAPTKDGCLLRPQDLPDGFRAEGDTWYFSRVCGTFNERQGWHGCQMPEQLLGRIIRVSSDEGEVVLDPFTGSGTTLVVAKKLGRRFIGFELSDQYARHADRRVSKASPGDSLEGPQEPIRNHRTSRGRPAASLTAGQEACREHSAALARVAVATGELTTAVAQAFLRGSDGFSIDRVMADPELNAAFIRECRGLGLDGKPREYNHWLLAFRKAGKLASLPRPKRTVVSREELDQFIFASEIAWNIVAAQHRLSLDEILCDPSLASEFDKTASRFAPGWRPFHYRWGALTLRKDASKKRQSARELPKRRSRAFLNAACIRIDEPNRIPEEAGVYLLEMPGVPLYLGETLKLRARLDVQRQHLGELLEALSIAGGQAPAVHVRFVITSAADRERWGVQSRLLGSLDAPPRANAYYEQQAFMKP